MENRLIILFVVLVAVAGVGGYVLGLYQGSGNFSLNVTNNSTSNVSNSTLVPKTTTNVTNPVNVKNTTNKTNNTPVNNTFGK